MQTIARENARLYALDRAEAPRLRVRPGERFVVETLDASASQLTRDRQSPFERGGLDVTPALSNPLAGPVHVEGVEKGDMLCIHIHRVAISPRHSATWTTNRGPLRDTARWPDADAPGVHILRHEPGASGTMADGMVQFSDRVRWAPQPFIGTIAVAPEREVHSSLLGQGAFGGNIDCRHIRAGSRLYLTAQVAGGLLALGDLHASQGDMEFTGVAAETEGEVELSVENCGPRALPFPRIETDDSLIALHISRPLDHALTQAAFLLIDWLSSEHGMSPRDAYLQISVNPMVRAHVYQMLPQMALNYVAGVEFPRSCIG
jgi:acetamidase/formamidase